MAFERSKNSSGRRGRGVGNSHNSFLELTSQLGFVGLSVMLLLIATAFWRGWRCWWLIEGPLGFMFLVYLIAAMVAAQAMENFG